MTEPSDPESTTLLSDATTPGPETSSTWHRLVWIPYVILTLILTLLAFISFMHYHYKNRGKYLGAVHKQNNSTACPRKYRVTLNRKGFVSGVVFGGRRSAANGRPHGVAGSDPSAAGRDIFIVGGADGDRRGPAVVWTSTAAAAASALGTIPSKTIQSYENEAYDCESSQGSEKSLLGRTAESLSVLSADVVPTEQARRLVCTDARPPELTRVTGIPAWTKSPKHGEHGILRLKQATVAPLCEEGVCERSCAEMTTP